MRQSGWAEPRTHGCAWYTAIEAGTGSAGAPASVKQEVLPFLVSSPGMPAEANLIDLAHLCWGEPNVITQAARCKQNWLPLSSRG